MLTGRPSTALDGDEPEVCLLLADLNLNAPLVLKEKSRIACLRKSAGGTVAVR
jgi:hypothetical protein